MRSAPLVVWSTVAVLGGLGVLVYLRVRNRAPGGAVTIEELGAAAGEVLDGLTESVRVAAGDLPRGIRNNNPGNIEWIDDPAKRWRGMVGRDGRYGIFDSMANGVRAIGGELRASINKRQTVSGAIYEWAPPTENNSAAYLAHVETGAGVNPDARLTVSMIPGIARVIVEHENGGLFGITQQQIDAWVVS